VCTVRIGKTETGETGGGPESCYFLMVGSTISLSGNL
jgi:hypothetical protein